MFQRACQAIMSALRGRFIPWLIALGQGFIIALRGIWKDWLDSLKAMAADFVIDDDPTYKDLQDFLATLRGHSTKLDEKIDRTIANGEDRIRREKVKMLLKFDQQSLRLQGSGYVASVAFNESFRLSVRSRLSNYWDDVAARAVARANALATALKNKRDAELARATAKAQSVFDKAELTRQQIAALRTPGLNGRSYAQLQAMLKNIKEGDNRSNWTREQIENQIKAVELSRTK
jgi:Cu/Ag efflux protein CusF